MAFALLTAGANVTLVEARAGELQLTWEQLVPPTPPLKNFLDELPPDEQEALDIIDYFRSFPERPLDAEAETLRNDAKADAAAARKTMAAKGVDIDAVYEGYMKWLTEVDRRGRLTQTAYNDKHVAIAGYLLPLDFDPNGSREFLLVPYVGACIHVPPPPPNQVVYLKTAEPHQMTDLFEAVVASGKMKVEPVMKDLSFMDGASTVESSYSLTAERLEPYEPKN
jgi:hypothetical protein